MTIQVNKNIKPKDIDKMLDSIAKGKKKINLEKYAGKVNFGMNGLAYQKKIRNEWS